MKIIYLVGIILVAVIAYSIYDLYHLSCLFGIDCHEDDEDAHDVKHNIVQPQEPKQQPKQATINRANLYHESQYVPNKGFLNELIFKHPVYSDELEQTSNTITNNIPSVPLNSPSCELSTDLPIANINVRYMLSKNTTMLR